MSINNFRILGASFLALLLAGCSHEGVELPEVVQIKKTSPYHKVSGEDTVESIAQKYGMTRSELVKVNNLEPPYQLYEGQRLIVKPKVEEQDEDGKAAVKNPDDGVVADAEAQSVDNPNGGNGVDVLTDKETIDDLQEVAEDKKLVPVKSDYIWPVANGKNKISQHFGANDVDGGIIIDASAGTPVKSIADGVVVIAGVPSGDAAAYGTTVVVKHTAKKTMSIYANLKETKVAVRQKVKQGTIIGKVGQSGTIARKPQLYFEINDLAGKGRQAVDPEKLLPK